MDEQTPGSGTCYVPQCGARIPKGRLMCGPHWGRVPIKARGAVWAALDAWEAGTGNLGDLRDAQDSAVAAVLGHPA